MWQDVLIKLVMNPACINSFFWCASCNFKSVFYVGNYDWHRWQTAAESRSCLWFCNLYRNVMAGYGVWLYLHWCQISKNPSSTERSHEEYLKIKLVLPLWTKSRQNWCCDICLSLHPVWNIYSVLWPALHKTCTIGLSWLPPTNDPLRATLLLSV